MSQNRIIIYMYVQNLLIVERCSCFRDCFSDLTANGLYKIIFDKFEFLSMYKIPIIFQAYDDDSIMSGNNTGLQTKSYKMINLHNIYIVLPIN